MGLNCSPAKCKSQFTKTENIRADHLNEVQMRVLISKISLEPSTFVLTCKFYVNFLINRKLNYFCHKYLSEHELIIYCL